ncbi:MAG: glucose-1-phosphate thymidylyltransferase RfbA [Lentisphaeria bacterium]|nr:glucose-1-phosphate thymidylyltransferase RfbA [Lentisphaeria bacterium]NQZ68374.1 glucose-1-phosphate thymidylyltransferase RfbA [Lentisphaeria bacterium]
MKGIILAGGAGSRLYPISLTASKQLQPVYDKPMIYYPLSSLMIGGIKDILLISTPQDLPRFEALLGTGEKWGINISYKVQEKPEGIAQAFLLGKEFIGDDNVTLILGDNIFYGNMQLASIVETFSGGGLIFGYYVKDPERYGVVEFDSSGKVVGIEEKPAAPKSNYCVPGLYIYDNSVIEVAEKLKASERGELEITDVNVHYLNEKKLNVNILRRGIAWLDTGTHSSLLEASDFIATIQARQGLKISCPEEIAFHMNFIDKEQLDDLIKEMPEGEYRLYLEERYKRQDPFEKH